MKMTLVSEQHWLHQISSVAVFAAERGSSHCVEHVLPALLFVVQRSPAARPAQCVFITSLCLNRSCSLLIM